MLKTVIAFLVRCNICMKNFKFQNKYKFQNSYEKNCTQFFLYLVVRSECTSYLVNGNLGNGWILSRERVQSIFSCIMLEPLLSTQLFHIILLMLWSYNIMLCFGECFQRISQKCKSIFIFFWVKVFNTCFQFFAKHPGRELVDFHRSIFYIVPFLMPVNIILIW